MAQVNMDPWATAQQVMADGAVSFTCSSDVEAWPWLALDPRDPIVIQTINFWASYQAGQARGGWEPDQWTALTHMQWEAGEPGCGHATHGVEDLVNEDGKLGYRLTFFDAAGALVSRMTGRGVVFRNRDFEKWRENAKSKLHNSTSNEGFVFAAPEKVGAPIVCGSVLAGLEAGEEPQVHGLMTADNGLAPANPYLSGSGDHVNATHLAEVVRQFDTLLSNGKKRLPRGGEMRFTNYVELGVPFTVTLTGGGPDSDHIAAEVHQADKLCTIARFDY